MKRLLLIIASPLLILISYIAIAKIALLVIGFHPDAIGSQLAEKLHQMNGNPNECNQIMHVLSHPFSPSAGEQRSNCLYKLAALKKDPDICRLLMPSQYGLACISNVSGEIIGNLPDPIFKADCNSEQTNRILRCIHWPAGNRVEYSFDNCESIKDSGIKEFCFQSVILEKGDLEKCQTLKSQRFREGCIYALDKTCKKNTIAALRTACEILNL